MRILDLSGAGFVLHVEDLEFENLSIPALSRNMSIYAKLFRDFSWQVQPMLNSLISSKNLTFLQPGWTRMIAPSNENIWNNRLVLGNMRRKLKKDDNIAKIWFNSANAAFKLYKSNNRKAPYGRHILPYIGLRSTPPPTPRACRSGPSEPGDCLASDVRAVCSRALCPSRDDKDVCGSHRLFSCILFKCIKVIRYILYNLG